ncbi:MAG TPA: LysM domain-containing protein [Solirubrobacterales bacterium]|nr:LysM domain-containing protein [Solirubrobacterales bacterium]
MNKRSSPLARIFAVAALAVALIVAVVAISSALGGNDSKDSSGRHHNAKTHKTPHVHVPVTYEVKSGDTLISIAHRMGVPVARIENLNPEIDPQSLIVGEQLKLREPR